MPKLLIFLTGLPGAGKTVFSEEVKSLGIPVVSLGDIVREEVLRRGLEPTQENILSVAQELRNIYGREAIAMLAIDKVKKLLETNCIVVIDGVRSLEEIIFIKNNVNVDTIIVAIHASPKTRFSRLLSRSRPGDPKNWEEFVERDLKELSWGLGSVIALADEILINEGSINEFKIVVRDYISKVKSKWCT
jgi:dephospho-CoA kinase